MGWLKKLDPTRSAKGIKKATKSLLHGDVKKSLSEFHDAQPLRGSKVDLLGTSEDMKGGVTENDSTKVGSASWNMGELMRKEWDDYVTRFQPYDNKLIRIATGQADNEAMVANARAGVDNSFAVSNGTTLRNLSRLGISQRSDEMQSNNRINDTNKTLADISASNNARMAAEDRDMKIMSGNAAVGLRDSRLQGA